MEFSGRTTVITGAAGVIGLTRAWAVEFGDFEITVNAVAPGLTATSKVMETFPPEFVDETSQNDAVKRKQKAEDLIGAIAFLASADAAFITGQTLNVDGGRSFL